MVDLASLKKLKEEQKLAKEEKPAEPVEKPASKKSKHEQLSGPEASIETIAKPSKPRQTKPRARRPKVEEEWTTAMQLKATEGYVPGIEEWHMVYKLITGQTIRAPGDQIKKAVLDTLDKAPLPNARHRGYHRSFDK
ncbi:MAG TPA: hypothetical protein VKM55_28135 [Candidatus Lokiarchaeia archaeon]|nr:hypothetical protein [Candidatus Lokiarchaeia archaeon]